MSGCVSLLAIILLRPRVPKRRSCLRDLTRNSLGPRVPHTPVVFPIERLSVNTRYAGLKRRRRGATLVLAAVLIVLVLGMVAFAVDIGYIVLVRTQLQVAADSSAMAAAAVNMSEPFASVLTTATRFAGCHVAGGRRVEVDAANVECGRWDFSTRRFTLSGSRSNAVRVTTTGQSPLFFAKVLGISDRALSTEAIAGFMDNFAGFRPPSSGENLPILPLALDQTSCNALLAEGGTDNWNWDAEWQALTPGSDGIPEVSLYPIDTGASGNFGTVDIGSSSNSTSDLARQILEGISDDDLSYHGGTLELGGDGELQLSGDTGLSASIGRQLELIKGQPRIVPVFERVTGVGSNAQYTIVDFVGVRVVEVQLTGKQKKVLIQRADVVVRGGIPARGTSQTSYHVFSPVSLVR